MNWQASPSYALILVFGVLACGKTDKSPPHTHSSDNTQAAPLERPVSKTQVKGKVKLSEVLNTAQARCEDKTNCNPSVSALYLSITVEDTFENSRRLHSEIKWGQCTGSTIFSTDEKMIILTNQHCLDEESITTLTCPNSIAAFPDGTKVRCQKVIWVANSEKFDSKHDVALLEFEAAPHIKALPYQLGNSVLLFEQYKRFGNLFTNSKQGLSLATQEFHQCTRNKTKSDPSFESASVFVDCDRNTIGGFSGSPLLAKGKIIGIHNLGHYENQKERKKTDRSLYQSFVSFECLFEILPETGFQWRNLETCLGD